MAGEKWGQGVPTPRRREEYTVLLSPGPKQVVKVIAAADDWFGIELHWLGKLSMPCLGEGCLYCHQKAPKRWKGYLAGYDPTSWGRRVLEITEEAARFSNASRFESISGYLLTCERKGNGARSPCELRVADFRGLKTGRGEWDVRSFLDKLFRVPGPDSPRQEKMSALRGSEN